MLQIDVSLIVVFLIVWVLVFFLSRLFFNPLRKIMQERNDKIQGGSEARRKSTETYEQTVNEIEERLKSARALSQQAMEKIEREAAAERERLLAEISEESRHKVEEAKKQLEDQIIGLKRKLESDASDLAERMERRLLD
ncbi:MAG: ATP synthase F0 subunit B [Candidatus Aminicenantes bacterium]|nr:ATP synthase F0 subunit B [Candidatus Aminicenantes bacterium]